MLGIVVSGEKLYVGQLTEEDIENSSTGILLKEGLEIREILVPTQDGQIQRMVNYTTLSPFDKTTHTILVKNISAVVRLEDNSDTQKSYEGFIAQLRMTNSGLVPPSAGAGFGGKFSPQR